MAESAKTETKKTTATTKTATAKKPELKFTKDALVTSSGFNAIDRDILRIVLEKDKEYTLNEANDEIKKFKEGI